MAASVDGILRVGRHHLLGRIAAAQREHVLDIQLALAIGQLALVAAHRPGETGVHRFQIHQGPGRRPPPQQQRPTIGPRNLLGVNRQALGKPVRNVVAGLLKIEDVGHLVLQRAGPGKVAVRPRFAGRDHGHDPPGAGRHRFQERQADHPRAEPGVARLPLRLVEDLHQRRARRLVAELLRGSRRRRFPGAARRKESGGRRPCRT